MLNETRVSGRLSWFSFIYFLLLHKINWINLPSWKPVPRKFQWDLILMIYFFLFLCFFISVLFFFCSLKKAKNEEIKHKILCKFCWVLIKFKLKLYMPPVQTMKINGISTELFFALLIFLDYFFPPFRFPILFMFYNSVLMQDFKYKMYTFT